MAPVRPAVMLEGSDILIVLEILTFRVPPEATFAHHQHIVPCSHAWLVRLEILAPWMADTDQNIVQQRGGCVGQRTGKIETALAGWLWTPRALRV